MRKTNQQSIGEIMKTVLKNLNIEDKVLESTLNDLWEKEMGVTIARYTTKLTFKNGNLTVFLSSPVLKQELSYSKEKILAMLNKSLGHNLITGLTIK
ncbi:MAG TPA: DUF721 domain-containing protein [Bacteroidales bacterium]|nr:DUF721 domain-containing protein [Bacteroidales bacterium]